MIETLASLIQQSGHDWAAPLARTESRASLENPSTPLTTVFSQDSPLGVSVSPGTAMQNTAVWASRRILCGCVASLPLMTYRRTPEGRERATDHYAYRLLHDQANPNMTAYRFRHLMQSWLLVHGNAYAAIEFNGRGQAVAMYPMKPSRVIVLSTPRGIFYQYVSDDGASLMLEAGEVFHLRWMSDDGIMGRSPIEVHRHTIGTALAQTQLANKFFANGMKIAGVLSSPEKLSDIAVARLRRNIESVHTGLDNAWKMMILEEGLKFEQTQSTMKDADYVAQALQGISDVSRIYGVPEHLLSKLDRSTNNNIEHQDLTFVKYTLTEHLKNWETELDFSLLSPRERQSIYFEHTLDALLRGDTLSRNQSYAIGIQNGYLKINEVRDMDNRNPVPGGDVPRTQMQMVPLGYTPAQQQIGA